MGGINFDGEVFKKNHRIERGGGGLPLTMGNPDLPCKSRKKRLGWAIKSLP